mmetsp:Transcript_8311/g.20009  ORF Transcript_8311/g.20009 Transcript_8311/m.20009 type:complete len:272 (-) Transcript_8311:2450-3265(-)
MQARRFLFLLLQLQERSWMSRAPCRPRRPRIGIIAGTSPSASTLPRECHLVQVEDEHVHPHERRQILPALREDRVAQFRRFERGPERGCVQHVVHNQRESDPNRNQRVRRACGSTLTSSRSTSARRGSRRRLPIFYTIFIFTTSFSRGGCAVGESVQLVLAHSRVPSTAAGLVVGIRIQVPPVCRRGPAREALDSFLAHAALLQDVGQGRGVRPRKPGRHRPARRASLQRARGGCVLALHSLDPHARHLHVPVGTAFLPRHLHQLRGGGGR